MDKKIVPLIGFLLIFAGFANAQFYILNSNSIQINVDSAGNAQIRERYFIQFQNEQQLAEFRTKVSEIGVSVDDWKTYDTRIYPRIGRKEDYIVNGISFTENEGSLDFLEINYALKTPIMEKKNETSRIIDYSLKTKFLNEFIDGTLWAIPRGTSITIQFPLGVEIQGPVKPDAVVENNYVRWTGYVFGNELELNARYFKQIASFDLEEALQEIIKSDLFMILIAAIAIISAVIIAKRQAIAQKIENYLIEHSDLGSEED